MADGVEELYRYDPRNRLTQLSRGGVVTPFRYDDAGNLLADDKALYSYDAFNRTTKVETIDGNVQINRYDAEGLRHELEENGRLVQFIFNSSREVVAEQDENKWTLYIRASSLLASSTDHARTYYHYASDEMGSTTHIVDGDGAVQNRYVYDAWGNVAEQTENVPNRFKFNGQQLDPISQQYYLRARFYNPVIARFTQEDTYRGDGLNLYAYCGNNPVVYEDPTGFARNCVKDAYDRIRRENPELSATEAYARALADAGRDRLPPKAEKPNADGPEKHDTPYTPLSAAERKNIKKKIENGTATREEYNRYDWDKRFNNRRRRGVDRFWSAEKKRLQAGESGTRNWTEQQRQDILAGKTPTHNGEPIEGHHMYNASDYPQIADDPNNIYPATNDEHFERWHGGNWQNDTNGTPNNPNFREEF